jgi:hypothetical protein
MARLIVKSEGFGNQVVELKLGITRLGRSPKNDFQIEHPTVSAQHCELTLEGNEIVIHDLESTNGTFVAGDPVKEARVGVGQTFCLGDVEFLVESTEVTVAIPRFEVERAAPPVVLSDGSSLCPRHPTAQVTHQCTYCMETLCDGCVTRLRRRGGKLLKLCPLCSHKVELIGGAKPKKKSILGFLHKTVKLPFIRAGKDFE